jgi:hypothetical protein
MLEIVETEKGRKWEAYDPQQRRVVLALACNWHADRGHEWRFMAGGFVVEAFDGDQARAALALLQAAMEGERCE